MKLSVSCNNKKYISIFLKGVCILLCAMLIFMLQQVMTYAYFDRGEVEVNLGLYETTAEAGSSVNVTVTFSPESSDQLPGCGMAECPQICGDGCLDENGECTCNGTEYETYYPSASVTSSNTSVATGSYSNGVVSIYAVSQGTAEITVTASLRQFRSTSATINVIITEPYTEAYTEPVTQRETESVAERETEPVTKQETEPVTKRETESVTKRETESVTERETEAVAKQDTGKNTKQDTGAYSGKDSETTTESGETETSSQKENSAGESSGTPVETKQISGNDYSDKTEENHEIESTTKEEYSETNSDDVLSQYSKISSGRGDIYFIEETDGESVAAVMKAIKGLDVYADFQNKDASDTVLYSWEFLGTDITGTPDTFDTAGYDLTLTTSSTAFTGMNNAPDGALYVSFAEEGKLPGVAELNLRVAESFENDSAVHVYEYTEDGSLVKYGDAVNVSNGYITLNLDKKIKLVLSAEDIKSAGKETVTIAETTQEPSSGQEREITSAAEDSVSTEEASGFPFWIIIIIFVVIAGAAAAVILKFKASGNKK